MEPQVADATCSLAPKDQAFAAAQQAYEAQDPTPRLSLMRCDWWLVIDASLLAFQGGGLGNEHLWQALELVTNSS